MNFDLNTPTTDHVLHALMQQQKKSAQDNNNNNDDNETVMTEASEATTTTKNSTNDEVFLQSMTEKLRNGVQIDVKSTKRLARIAQKVAPHVSQNPEVLTAILIYLAVNSGIQTRNLCNEIENAVNYCCSGAGLSWFQCLTNASAPSIPMPVMRQQQQQEPQIPMDSHVRSPAMMPSSNEPSQPNPLSTATNNISSLLAHAAERGVSPMVPVPRWESSPSNYSVPRYSPQVGLQAFLNDVMNS